MTGNGNIERTMMNELLIVLLVIAVWFFIQGWLLPKLGIST